MAEIQEAACIGQREHSDFMGLLCDDKENPIRKDR